MSTEDLKSGILITGAAGGLGAELVRQAVRRHTGEIIIAADNNETILHQFAGNPKVKGAIMDTGSERSI